MNFCLHGLYRTGIYGCLVTTTLVAVPITAKFGALGSNKIEFNDTELLRHHPKVKRHFLYTKVNDDMFGSGPQAYFGKFSKLYFRPVKIYHNGKEMKIG